MYRSYRFAQLKPRYFHWPKITIRVTMCAVLVYFMPTQVVDGAEPIDKIIAVVSGDIVMESELREQIQRFAYEAQQQGAPMPPPQVLKKQVLERLIVQKAQIQSARRQGLKVNDQMLRAAIDNIARKNNLTVPEFKSTLVNEGYDFDLFQENIRNEILVNELQQREVVNRVQVTDAEIENYLATQENQGNIVEAYRLGHILIEVGENATEEKRRAARQNAEEIIAQLLDGADFRRTAMTVSDGQHALQGGDLGWIAPNKLPSLFVDIVPKMGSGDLSELIENPSGFHIVKLLGVRGADGEEPHDDGSYIIKQTQARHILIKLNELISDSDAELKLQQLKQRIENGDDFTELARSHSDDTGSAAKGGDLDWVSLGQMVPQFEQAMENTSIGAISAPFRTQYGWHIVQVLDRRQLDDTVQIKKNRAREALRRKKIKEERQAWIQRLRDEAYVEYR